MSREKIETKGGYRVDRSRLGSLFYVVVYGISKMFLT